MNQHPHEHEQNHDTEHGTVLSYVAGFILSLIFTFIPYVLVVNKVIAGNVLLVTILGFAFLQMLVQIIFFLHLGRGPKPRWNLYFFAATFGTILFIITASIMIMTHLHYNMTPTDKITKIANDEGIYKVGNELTGACQGQYANHKVIIKNGVVSPSVTAAKKCDTLTFVNEDDKTLNIAFGPHPNHDIYAGEEEETVRKGFSKTITLSVAGTYQFHDHLEYKTAGSFTVAP